MGSEVPPADDAQNAPTALSRMASRQRSTSGKSCAADKEVDNARVISAHCTSIAPEGDGPSLGLDAVEKRAFNAGIRTVVKVCLMRGAEGRGGFAVSMNDTSFFETVSRSGTWANKIGFVETESKAGIDFCVCGCAGICISWASGKVRYIKFLRGYVSQRRKLT